MEIDLTGLPGLALRIEEHPPTHGAYPTARLQKGLLLVWNGETLAEEAVGFGVPVLKRGLRAVFPGAVELSARRESAGWVISAVFRMNLEEKLRSPGGGVPGSGALYAAKNFLAELIRRFPVLRGVLTSASSALRRTFGWETTYEVGDFSVPVKMLYTVRDAEGRIRVEVDAAGLIEAGVDEVAVMNEQGGRAFDRYADSGGLRRRGGGIGCWDLVTAGEASFISEAHGLAFTLGQAAGARLYRGRELVGARLAWSGFGYTFRPPASGFAYDLRIERWP